MFWDSLVSGYMDLGFRGLTRDRMALGVDGFQCLRCERWNNIKLWRFSFWSYGSRSQSSP